MMVRRRRGVRRRGVRRRSDGCAGRWLVNRRRRIRGLGYLLPVQRVRILGERGRGERHRERAENAKDGG
jgi:hypothetical protein